MLTLLNFRSYLNSPLMVKRWAIIILKLLCFVLIFAVAWQYHYTSTIQNTVTVLSVQKEILIREINENERKRLSLQKTLFETLQNGMKNAENTQKNHQKDEKLIESAVNDADGDTNEMLFKRKFGTARQYKGKK